MTERCRSEYHPLLTCNTKLNSSTSLRDGLEQQQWSARLWAILLSEVPADDARTTSENRVQRPFHADPASASSAHSRFTALKRHRAKAQSPWHGSVRLGRTLCRARCRPPEAMRRTGRTKCDHRLGRVQGFAVSGVEVVTPSLSRFYVLNVGQRTCSALALPWRLP